MCLELYSVHANDMPSLQRYNAAIKQAMRIWDETHPQHIKSAWVVDAALDGTYACLVSDHTDYLFAVCQDPMVMASEQRGILTYKGIERITSWVRKGKRHNVLLWVEGAHEPPLVNVRCSGGTLVQLNGGLYGHHSRAAVMQAVVGAAFECQREVREFTQRLEEVRGRLGARVMDACNRSDIRAAAEGREVASPHIELEQTFLNVQVFGTLAVMEIFLQARVRSASQRADFAAALLHFRRRRALRRIAKGVDDNLEAIKARIWHPEGRLMQRKFVEMRSRWQSTQVGLMESASL